MKKIYFKDGSNETVSSDLLWCINDFKEILRNRLGDDTEEVFNEIISDVFDYGVSEATTTYKEFGFGEIVCNPFLQKYSDAGVSQLVEGAICNRNVKSSSLFIGSRQQVG